MTRDEKRSCNNCMYRRVCRTCRDCGDMAWCCSTYTHYIDRDALLALADKVFEDTEEDMSTRGKLIPAFIAGQCLRDVARRIREALGENDDY